MDVTPAHPAKGKTSATYNVHVGTPLSEVCLAPFWTGGYPVPARTSFKHHREHQPLRYMAVIGYAYYEEIAYFFSFMLLGIYGNKASCLISLAPMLVKAYMERTAEVKPSQIPLNFLIQELLVTWWSGTIG